jgi:NTP pyrophosphatase (non-canonical NTP hydrolase)
MSDRDAFRANREAGLRARHQARLARTKTLEVMQAEVLEINARHDWGNGKPVPFQTAIANLHGEVSEAWEAWRKWGLDDATADAGMAGGVVDYSAPPKPEGVGSEFADIFIRLLDNCATYGVDLRAEYERKVAYNRTRPVKHGGKRA